MKEKTYTDQNTTGAWTTERMIRFVVCLAGFFLLGAFILRACGTPAALPLCIVGFVFGGVKVTIRSQSGGKDTTIEPAGAAAFAAALACGPIGAAGPAAMAALGGILLDTNHHETLGNTFYRTSRLIVQSALAGLVFGALTEWAGDPIAAVALPAALAAAVVYFMVERILSRRPVSIGEMSLSFGMGYILTGAVVRLPSFVIFAAALPLAVVLLGLLRSARQIKAAVSETSDDEQPRPSLIDPLTGLANQRYMDMFLRQEISRSERSGQPITVLLIDIDDFIQLNESEGKESGDRCLGALGNAIKETVREYDLAVRYKDDEFAVILPETDASVGFEIAHRLHSTLSGKILPHRVKFSIGAATYPVYGTSSDDLLSSAHHALNRAKFSGKNVVKSCHELAKAS